MKLKLSHYAIGVMACLVVISLFSACDDSEGTSGSSADSTSTALAEKYPTKSGTTIREERLGQYSSKTDKDESDWDKDVGTVHAKDSHFHVRNEKYKFFGWHPYYMGTSYKSYNFKLLWGISYFGMLVDPATGGYSSIHSWKTTNMVDMAKADGCKVFITATNFGAANHIKLFQNPTAVENLINTLDEVVKMREAHGINIDFEGVPASVKTEFNDFLVKLSQKIKTSNPDAMMTLALYAVDFSNVFDIKTIDPHIDLYTIMGYDYYYGGSPTAGPVSPLTSGSKWTRYNLTKTVDFYVGLGATKSNVLLALPYYGREWKVNAANEKVLPTKSLGFVKAPIYRDIVKEVDTANAGMDWVSMSRYVNRNLSGTEVQLWYDDVTTLASKYDMVKEKGLAGVGIWALGYDNGNGELWRMAGIKFGDMKTYHPESETTTSESASSK